MNRTIFCLILFLLCVVACQNGAEVFSDSKTAILQSFNKDGYANGKILFTEKCQSCHRPDKKDGFNMNFWKQVPGESDSAKLQWFRAYLSNSDSLAKAGDSHALALKAEYNHVPSHHLKLDKKEVKLVVHFLNYYDSTK